MAAGMNSLVVPGTWLAAAVWAAAVAGFGLASPEFSQRLHPVALLGAAGEPNALAFNLLGFVLPGALIAWVAIALRTRAAEAGWPRRVGLQLVLLSALAFAAQGLLPLDPLDLGARASRLHALAWSLWWIAFVPGALLAAAGRGMPRAAGIALALLVPAFALFVPGMMAAGVAQRIAFGLWFAWWLVAAASGAREHQNQRL